MDQRGAKYEQRFAEQSGTKPRSSFQLALGQVGYRCKSRAGCERDFYEKERKAGRSAETFPKHVQIALSVMRGSHCLGGAENQAASTLRR